MKLCSFIFTLVFACFCVNAVRAQETMTAATTPTAIEAGARPALRLRGLDGKTYDVADMRGSVVLASFGATWCQPCHAEVAALEEVRAEYKGKPVRFVWISIESDAEISDALLRHRAKGMRITMPVLRDKDMSIYSQFSARKRMPLVVVFDRDGALATAPMFGMSDAETYKKRVREKLDGALRVTPSEASVTAATSSGAR